MRIRRTAISGAILAFWLAMMALLVRNHILPRYQRSDTPRIRPEMLTEEWRDYEEWMRFVVGQRSDGMSYTALRRLPDGTGYLAGSRIWLDFDVFGSRHAFRLQMTALLNPSFSLSRAVADVELDDMRMHFRALATNRRMTYRWQFGEQVRVGTQRLREPISLLEAVRPLVARRVALEVGNQYRISVLDSTWSMRGGTAEVRVVERKRIAIGGKAYDAFRLVTTLNNLQSTTWVSPNGEILRREFANYLVMERVDPQKAREDFPGIDAPFEVPHIASTTIRKVDGQAVPIAQEVGPMNLLLEMLGGSADKR